jgi:hypothetical protein
MEEKSAYVPPKYIPISGSDAENDLASVNDGQQPLYTLKDDPNQWSSGICTCFDDPQLLLGDIMPMHLIWKECRVLGIRHSKWIMHNTLSIVGPTCRCLLYPNWRYPVCC